METPHEYQYCNLVLFAHYLELVITTFYFYFSSDYINYISALLYVAIFKVCIPLFVIKGEITIFSLFIPFFLFFLCVCEHVCMYVWMFVPVHACVDVRSWNLVSSYTASQLICVCDICMCVVCGMLCVYLLVQMCSGSGVFITLLFFYFTFTFHFN